MAKAKEIVIRFDTANTRAEGKIAGQAGNLITQLTDDARSAARETILRGYERGRGPNDIALDLAGRVNRETGRREGGILGLSLPQTRAANNMRQSLEEGDFTHVLGLKLRDKRFDSVLEKAREDKTSLTSAQIDKMHGKYVDNSLKLRSETVARTETGKAVHEAQLEAVLQGLEKTGFGEDAIERIWRATGDAKTRDTHADMDGQVVQGLEEPFVTGSGAELMFPLDDSLGAPVEEIVNCRCDMEINIDYSVGLADPEDTPLEPVPDIVTGEAVQAADEIVPDEPLPVQREVFKDNHGTSFAENLLPHVDNKVLNSFQDAVEADRISRNWLIDRTVGLQKLDAVETTVRIETLLSDQSTVEMGLDLTRLPKTLPEVTMLPDGTMIVTDGNHQLNTMLLRGIEEARVTVNEFKFADDVIQAAAVKARQDISEAVIDILKAGGGTVNDMANQLVARFPEKSFDDLRNSLRSFLVRLPKQGRVNIIKEGNTYRADTIIKPPEGIRPPVAPPRPPVLPPEVRPPLPPPAPPPEIKPPGGFDPGKRGIGNDRAEILRKERLAKRAQDDLAFEERMRLLNEQTRERLAKEIEDRKKAIHEVFQPVSDRTKWNTPQQAMDGFKINHKIDMRWADQVSSEPATRRLTNTEQRMTEFVTKVRDVDKALTDMKQSHPGLIGRESLEGGIDINTDGNNLTINTGGRQGTVQALGAYSPMVGRMQLAGSLRTVDDNLAQVGRRSIANGNPLAGPGVFSVDTRSIASTFRHEFGHSLENKTYGFGIKFTENVAPNDPLRFVDWWKEAAGNPNTKVPSRYARTNKSELFAESTSVYFHPEYVRGGSMLDLRIETYFDKMFSRRTKV